MQTQDFGTPTHIATLKGKVVEFDQAHYDDAIAWLVTEAGGYDSTLKIREKSPSQIPAALQAPADDATDTKLDRAMRHGRLTVDAEAATAAGFSLKDPIYALGRKVLPTGAAAAKTSRLAFDKKPLVKDACAKFADQVASEARKDTAVVLADLRMSIDGVLIAVDPSNPARKGPVQMSEGSFDRFCSLTPMGGSGYLKSCWPELRAHNVNEWMKSIGHLEADARRKAIAKSKPEPKPSEVVLRCRNNASGTRETYAVVSKHYQAFDCDVVAKALFEAAPADARGSVVYDGTEARFEILFHSDVKFEDYGAGEIFRAGVIVRTNDVGQGSIVISSMVERNLCLNLMILDTAEFPVARIRHQGKELVSKFQQEFQNALGKIGHFRTQWGYARADVLAPTTSVVAGKSLLGLSQESLLSGILWAQMKQDLVPVRGRKPEVLRSLMQAYADEPHKAPKLTRADVVNVWTRYAHESAAQVDPWIEDDIQAAAGKILGSKKPIPYEAVPFAL